MNRNADDDAKRPSLLRRLDKLPAPLALGVSVPLGAAVGAAVLMETPLVVGAAVFVVVLALAGVLAWSGEPVAVLDRGGDESPRRQPELSVDLVAGRFRMGSPDDEKGRFDWEGPVHEVQISAFECMRCPVTRRLYDEIVGEDPGWPEGQADERPVNNVSWFDAVGFCNRLSEKDGLTACYQVDGGNVAWNRDADGYRLPTEAEWEYACRAGSSTRWSFGDDEEQLGDFAWYSANSDGKPHPVGSKERNPRGLHDMHGNVWEWCWDWFGSYSKKAQVDPEGPSEGGSRVLRGGSFAFAPGVLRSAFRGGNVPEFRGRDFGFRCVRVPRRQLGS